MEKVFTEENNCYCFDCTQSLWATDQIHQAYAFTEGSLNDVDFVIETEEKIFMVEYKNASISGAVNPEAFQPGADKKIANVVKKFYDSLHYMYLTKKEKPKVFVYVLEYPNGDSVSRKMIRNRLKKKLPFQLQDSVAGEVKLIEKVDVVSIDEWNQNREYGIFPIRIKSER